MKKRLSKNFKIVKTLLIASIVTAFCFPAASQPTQRIDGGLFYYPPMESLLTFGGWGPPDWEQSPEVWSLNASGWSQMPDMPEGVAHTSAVYDEANSRLIVMGGASPDKSTWSFDGNSWIKIADPLTSEYGFDPEMIYLPDTQEIILYFAAMSWSPDDASNSKTYILDDNGWVEQTVDPAPGAFADVGFVYDSARKEGVWFNGHETWVWNNNGWLQKYPSNSPSYESGQFTMTYDEARSVALVYGQGETWSWDGADWSKLAPQNSPTTPERGFFALGYDVNRQTAILFGGEVMSEDGADSTYLEDLWEWNGQTWSVFGETVISDWEIH